MNQDDLIDELDALLLEWEDENLDDAGVERVREILRNNEHARSHFVRMQMIGAAIKIDDAAGISNPGSAPATEFARAFELASESKSGGIALQTPTQDRRTWRLTPWMLALAGLFACVLIGRLVQLELASSNTSIVETDNDNPSKETMFQGVAMVTRLVDAEWASGQAPLEVGDAILPGRLALKSGFAQVEFFCGATVIVEGPAEIELQSPLLARVRSGRLRAQVPPAARGFSLEVDDMKVVDLGTEFGLSVSQEGSSVQVFDGEVELQHNNAEKQLLTAGEALTRTGDGEYEQGPAKPDNFLDIAALETRARGQQDKRYEDWKAWSEKFSQDERLIAYYAFDQNEGWNRRLESSLSPANPELDGAIVGANRVPGRWSAKAALEFKQPGDRVRVQIPGEFQSLSFACWVKIDSLDRQFNSLFLTDNYNKGEPHWQILENGRLYFSVRPSERNEPGPTDFKALSPPFWNASLSGRWIHLAVVYNFEDQTISHFFNGTKLSCDELPDEKVVPAQIGAASIGNWSLPTQAAAEFAIRNLNGSIDEFAIFSSALSDEEIKEIFANGKP